MVGKEKAGKKISELNNGQTYSLVKRSDPNKELLLVRQLRVLGRLELCAGGAEGGRREVRRARMARFFRHVARTFL